MTRRSMNMNGKRKNVRSRRTQRTLGRLRERRIREREMLKARKRRKRWLVMLIAALTFIALMFVTM